ncbi:MAG: hypothetical protein WC378_17450 [Opitutaceae bacterium]|jgi:hypothetical protein
MPDPIIYAKILDIQDEVAALLKADSFFADDEIITERKGDLGQRITAALNKLGLSIRVLTPEAIMTKRSATRRIFRVRVVVECAETALLNKDASGNRRYALSAATAAAMAIDYHPNGQGGTDCATPLDHFESDMENAIVQPSPELLIYQAHFFTEIAINTKS